MCPPEDRLLRHVTRQPMPPQRHVPHQQTPLQRHVSVRQRNAGQSSRWGPPTGIAAAGRETPAPSRKPETKTTKRRTRAQLSPRRPFGERAIRRKEALEFRPLRGRCRSETGAPLPCALRAGERNAVSSPSWATKRTPPCSHPADTALATCAPGGPALRHVPGQPAPLPPPRGSSTKSTPPVEDHQCVEVRVSLECAPGSGQSQTAILTGEP